MARTRRTPSYELIALAQADLLASLCIPQDEATTTCWRCRYVFTGTKPERAHIDAVKHYGDDSPSNFLLLCSVCHNEQPDGADRQYQINWLSSKQNAEDKIISTTDFVSEQFERAAGVPLSALLEKLMDRHGIKGMMQRFESALREGKEQRARVTHISGLSNAVARLVQLWESIE